MSASSDVLAAEFDTTLDDWTDVSARSEVTEIYRGTRRRAQWSIGLIAAGVAVVAVNQWSTLPALATVAIASAVVFAAGLPTAFAYGRYYDWYARGHARRTLAEMFDGAASVRCRMELRAEGLWSGSPLGEMILPWRTLTRIDDVPGAIEFWSDLGLAVVRDRAFTTAADRAAFLARARELAGVESA